MKQTVSKGILLILAMGAYTTSWAQAGSGGNGFGSVLTYSLIAIAVLIFFFLIIQVLVFRLTSSKRTAEKDLNNARKYLMQ